MLCNDGFYNKQPHPSVFLAGPVCEKAVKYVGNILFGYSGSVVFYAQYRKVLLPVKAKTDHSPFGREAYRVEHKVLEYAYKLLPVSVYHDRLIVLRQKFKRYTADIDVRLIPGIKITQQQAQIKRLERRRGGRRTL